MQYLLMIYDPEKIWPEMAEADRNKMFGEYMQFTKDLKASGHFIAGDALQPTKTATTIRVRDGKTSSTDGPFAETKEQLGGYYLIDVPDLDGAVHWAARCPAAMGGSIEVRPLGHSAPSDK